jgi:hypothetical protein
LVKELELTMLNFPLPYPDELVYSVVARAGVHMGITSPKQLLQEVFSNRLIIATADLPSHLNRLLRLYPEKLGYSEEQLAYEHTLFPVYAAFTTEDRRKRCLEKMAVDSNGSIHLMLGVAASRVKQSKYLRYCPSCLQQQLKNYGEFFWKRQWQVIGADCCLEHGLLLNANIYRHEYHRHQFFPASPAVCPIFSQQPALPSSVRVARQIERLFRYPSHRAATFDQWSCFYRELANRSGCLTGQNVRHEAVFQRILSRWPASWLEEYGLGIQQNETTWLRTIFRKHRKAFSYLEHIVVLESLLPESWLIDDILADVRSIKNCKVNLRQTDETNFQVNINESTTTKRKLWSEAIHFENIKQARKKNPALYAWLYRYDKTWLLNANRQAKKPTVRECSRINWENRDISVCRQLVKIHNANKTLLDLPRLSKNWYLSQLDHRATVEKNLTKMPLTASFFKQHCENIDDFQIRRIERILSRQGLETQTNKHWQVLRMAGLSNERITKKAKDHLISRLGNEHCTT